MRIVLLLALAGCASPAPAQEQHYAYRLDHLSIPTNNTEARAYALGSYNEIGTTLGTMSSMGIDSADATARAVSAGMISIGLDLPVEDAVDGTHALPDPVSIAISIVDPTLVVPIDLVGARVELTGVDDTGIAQGVVAGGVTTENLRDDLYPMLAVAFGDLVKRDCDATCKCQQYSTGALLVEYIDYPTRDCNITVDEVATNSLVASLFAPDVTIDGQKVVSFGVGFSATRRN